jgi:DNA-binding SARP family transcriptional activator
VRTLGTFAVLRDGEPVPTGEWQSRKARDLLKMLVARRGRSVAREVLMDALWPGEDPERLSNRLSVALATIRAVLDPEKRHAAEQYVAVDGDSVRLELSALVVDVEHFLADAAAGLRLLERGREQDAMTVLAAAEAAYSGDFLEEDPYQDWANPLREEARAAYIAVAHALADAARSAGDADSVARYELRILERDPYDEQAHLRLVTALAHAGQHGEARRHYRAYGARMREIDVEAVPYPVP